MATILITVINIVAGFLIGVFQQGVPFQQALKTYTILTVGDGLVAIIPSLLVSVAGGIVVTRAASTHSLGTDIGKQMFRTARPLWIVGGVLLALALIPGMPKFSFIALGAGSDVCRFKAEIGKLSRNRGRRQVGYEDRQSGSSCHRSDGRCIETRRLDVGSWHRTRSLGRCKARWSASFARALPTKDIGPESWIPGTVDSYH